MDVFVNREEFGYSATNGRITVYFNVSAAIDSANMAGDDEALGVILEIANETLVERENATR